MNKKHRKLLKRNNAKGFTLIELLLVLGMSSILFGLIIFNLLRFQNTSSQQSNTDALVSDIQNQQLKAMLGSTEGRSDNDSYGVYFLADRYVLFHGTTYDENNPDNFEVELPSDLAFQSTTFPSNTIVFTKLSGEIPGFTTGADTITIRSLNINRDVSITFNRYGVITGIN